MGEGLLLPLAMPIVLALAPAPPPLPGGSGVVAASIVASLMLGELPAACPADMTLVDGMFCPSLRYSCKQPVDPKNTYRCAEYASEIGCDAPLLHRRFCIDLHEYPNRVGELPRVYVSWYEARRLCGEQGKRLCRRTEWIFACEGPKRLPYPWGFRRLPSPCNIDRAVIDFDVYALVDPASRDDELARLWQGDAIGSHPGCVSAFGAYDMSGNVDEWTDDQLDNPGTSHVSTLNGGYWGLVRNTCRLTTTSHGPTFEFYQVGFRCCSDPQDGDFSPSPGVVVLPEMQKPN